MTDSALAVALGGVLAFAEAILGVGIVLPGEVMISGVAASVDSGDRGALVLTVALGASTGDHLNYWLGRVLGPRLSNSRIVARIGRQRWERAVALTRRYGALAIIVSRMMPFVRTLVASTAGVTVLGYRRFAVASAVDSCLWAAAWVLVGSALSGGAIAWILGGCLAALVSARWLWHRRTAPPEAGLPVLSVRLRTGQPAATDEGAASRRHVRRRRTKSSNDSSGGQVW